jgi:ABC-type nickel/cobalt efflux system permease component RcnA
MIQDIVSLQREIYQAFAAQIQSFADGGGWNVFLAYLPMGILFGAVHTLTPGHSKAVLATYLAGNPLGLARSLTVSLVLSFTHVAMSVLIALLSLPLVSIALGSVGRAPLLEDVSRGLLGLIGLWMLYRALRGSIHAHDHGEGALVGFMAGLVPCPLTLFVMTFAISRGVPEAGIAFAVTMMTGVAFVLAAVAAITVVFRQQVMRLVERRPMLFDRIARGVEGLAGLFLIAVALRELAWR